MRKTAFIFLACTLLLSSCKESTPQQQQQDPSILPQTKDITDHSTIEQQNTTEVFNIEDIPLSTQDIGEFPFINLPQGLRPLNKPFERKFDICFFPINAVMTPFEGRLYKSYITSEKGEEYSQHYFEKSLENYLLSMGAVKVFDGEITKEEYQRYNKQDPNKGNEGDMGYGPGENIKFFILRTTDKGNIYVQFTSNNAGGTLNILQEQDFKQTITKVTADQISKDLSEKGKSILYINFDVDQATVSTQSMEIVDQITLVLQKDTTLKISIEGHTDNSGEPSHNKKLSSDRANAVKTVLISKGIDENRLSTKGLGSDFPLTNNDTQENKAKNRRVELVKM